MTRFYTGVGSRGTPDDILTLMKEWAKLAADQGWCVRTGGAPGADQAFELGARMCTTPWETLEHEVAEVFLPWKGFEGRASDISDPLSRYYDTPQSEAYAIAQEFHPRWHSLNQAGRRFHARNVHQVYGPNVNKPFLSEFVVCWTKGGKGGGGTGQALRIAEHFKLPIFDFGIEENKGAIAEHLNIVLKE